MLEESIILAFSPPKEEEDLLQIQHAKQNIKYYRNQFEALDNSINRLFGDQNIMVMNFHIKTIEYWCDYMWDEILQNNYADRIREFLFENIISNVDAFDSRILCFLTDCHASFIIHYIENWPNFFSWLFKQNQHFIKPFLISLLNKLCRFDPYMVEFVKAFHLHMINSSNDDVVLKYLLKNSDRLFCVRGILSLSYWIDIEKISNDDIKSLMFDGMSTNDYVPIITEYFRVLISRTSSYDLVAMFFPDLMLQYIGTTADNSVIQGFSKLLYTSSTEIMSYNSETTELFMNYCIKLLSNNINQLPIIYPLFYDVLFYYPDLSEISFQFCLTYMCLILKDEKPSSVLSSCDIPLFLISACFTIDENHTMVLFSNFFNENQNESDYIMILSLFIIFMYLRDRKAWDNNPGMFLNFFTLIITSDFSALIENSVLLNWYYVMFFYSIKNRKDIESTKNDLINSYNTFLFTIWQNRYSEGLDFRAFEPFFEKYYLFLKIFKSDIEVDPNIVDEYLRSDNIHLIKSASVLLSLLPIDMLSQSLSCFTDSRNFFVFLSEYDAKLDEVIQKDLISLVQKFFSLEDDLLSYYILANYKLQPKNILNLLFENAKNINGLRSIYATCKVFNIETQKSGKVNSAILANIGSCIIPSVVNLVQSEAVNPWHFEIRNQYLEMFFQFEVFVCSNYGDFSQETQEQLFEFVKNELILRYCDYQIMISLMKISTAIGKYFPELVINDLTKLVFSFIWSPEYDPCTISGNQISKACFEYLYLVRSISNEAQLNVDQQVTEFLTYLGANVDQTMEYFMKTLSVYNSSMIKLKRLPHEIELSIRAMFQSIFRSRLNLLSKRSF